MVRRAISHYNTLSENRSSGDKAVYAEFGRRLQARMIALGWNQSELSRRASAYLPKPAKGQVQGHSLGRDRISSYIRGKYLPRPDALEALAKALGCKPSDLLPAGGVPSVAEEGPLLEMRSIDGQRVALRINRVVSLTTATKIIALLEQEDNS
jgi:transcriptional regulator with XRE-family HTH domain